MSEVEIYEWRRMREARFGGLVIRAQVDDQGKLTGISYARGDGGWENWLSPETARALLGFLQELIVYRDPGAPKP